MLSAFIVYLELGFRHIVDLGGQDHILFVVALAAGYGVAQWRELAVLVTAFTLGHSLTLIAASLRGVSVSGAWVEFLIPLTIVLTAFHTLASTRATDPGVDGDGAAGTPGPDRPGAGSAPEDGVREPARFRTQRPARAVGYGMALFFGLIHGLGFSNFLRALLGAEENILWPLFAFNVGLEVGQLAILSVLLTLTFLATHLLPMRRRTWTRILSIATALPALYLLASRLPT